MYFVIERCFDVITEKYYIHKKCATGTTIYTDKKEDAFQFSASDALKEISKFIIYSENEVNRSKFYNNEEKQLCILKNSKLIIECVI